MKILKYKKIKNKYRVYFDNNSFIDLYENTILKYELLLKKEVDKDLLETIKEDNRKEEMFDICIKYISIKMRTKTEIKNYLRKKGYQDNSINEIINILIEKGYINEENYIKAYIYDKFNLTSDGPNKIKESLLKENLNYSLIDKYINEIKEEDIIEKLDRLVIKKIKLSNNYSGNILKYKITSYFFNLGYDKKYIDIVLSNKNLNNNENTIKERIITEKKEDKTAQINALDSIRKDYGLKFKDSKLKSIYKEYIETQLEQAEEN